MVEDILNAVAMNLPVVFLLACVLFVAGSFHSLFKFTDGDDDEE